MHFIYYINRLKATKVNSTYLGCLTSNTQRVCLCQVSNAWPQGRQSAPYPISRYLLWKKTNCLAETDRLCLSLSQTRGAKQGGGLGGLNPPEFWMRGLKTCQPPWFWEKIFRGGWFPLNWSNYIVYVFLFG